MKVPIYKTLYPDFYISGTDLLLSKSQKNPDNNGEQIIDWKAQRVRIHCITFHAVWFKSYVRIPSYLDAAPFYGYSHL